MLANIIHRFRALQSIFKRGGILFKVMIDMTSGFIPFQISTPVSTGAGVLLFKGVNTIFPLNPKVSALLPNLSIEVESTR